MAEETSSQLPNMGGLPVEEVAENEATQQEKPLEERIKLPYAFARDFGVVMRLVDNQVEACFKEAPALSTVLEIQRLISTQFAPVKLTEEEFDNLLSDTYQNDSSEAQRIASNMGDDVEDLSLADELNKADLLDNSENSPMVRFINAMLAQAVKEEASDIHVEPYENKLVIRFRVDGVLHENIVLERKFTPYLISRIKVMSKMDISEKRIPQDGRISLIVGGKQVDVRVSTIPTSYSERIVMRILDKNSVRLNLRELGLTPAISNEIEKLIRMPHGIILVTGPTGSGKSTTLYAAISDINSKERNILTVEDPVEYDLEGIGQTPVNPKVDMTFARALRAILRQDPDVVMIGEIRDHETAEIAVQASLTGHLVLSSLLAVLAQRLVRTLCKNCREESVTTPHEMELMGLTEPRRIYRACGCSDCNNTGYRGRCGIHELVEVNDDVRLAIHGPDGELGIEKVVRPYTPTIRQDGFSKVLAGMTTIEEVMRVTSGE